MSDEKNRKEAGRWLAAANDDLESARILKKNGQYAHACFHAQQAAEKSLKAVWIHEDADPWGHSIKKLIDDLESVNPTTHQYFDQYAHSGLVLDRYYIPTRYPNGLPDLTPAEAFLQDDASHCLRLAEIIVAAVDRYISDAKR